MSKHPITRVIQMLNKDTELINLLNNKRGTSTPTPLIFSRRIPEDYQKTSNAPFIRVTQIHLSKGLYNDSDSDHYRFSFAVEVFGKSLTDAYELSESVISALKPYNARVFDIADPDTDTEFNLEIQMLSFNIILKTKGDNING
ncbi:hypothetical protein P3U62_08175 [Mammaliicoccus vitulinus]|uniref:hypothetical protein n=1 Tax=Mammaliicoccus vitulinus TaxID=71237 RepID=UPI002B260B59|nr:hypothetical protein [Mammaliicoccus vitulinus]WQK87027.1 hypothetical protein P3U62_08175 [Mammaliicoccus vitulinus]